MLLNPVLSSHYLFHPETKSLSQRDTWRSLSPSSPTSQTRSQCKKHCFFQVWVEVMAPPVNQKLSTNSGASFILEAICQHHGYERLAWERQMHRKTIYKQGLQNCITYISLYLSAFGNTGPKNKCVQQVTLLHLSHSCQHPTCNSISPMHSRSSNRKTSCHAKTSCDF